MHCINHLAVSTISGAQEGMGAYIIQKYATPFLDIRFRNKKTLKSPAFQGFFHYEDSACAKRSASSCSVLSISLYRLEIVDALTPYFFASLA